LLIFTTRVSLVNMQNFCLSPYPYEAINSRIHIKKDPAKKSKYFSICFVLGLYDIFFLLICNIFDFMLLIDYKASIYFLFCIYDCIFHWFNRYLSIRDFLSSRVSRVISFLSLDNQKKYILTFISSRTAFLGKISRRHDALHIFWGIGRRKTWSCDHL